MDSTYNINGAIPPALKRTADRDGPDFYPTPAWATHALLHVEHFAGKIWEPACGDGSMSKVLESAGHAVYSSDLYDRGFGNAGIDFLEYPYPDNRTQNIVTNPPFNSAEGFLRQSLSLAEQKVCLLLRLAFLEGVNRKKTIFDITPPSRVWVFSERITFYPKDVERAGSGTTAYAWFVWDKWQDMTDAVNGKDTPKQTVVKWIPTGIRAKYGGR